ncbi:MAG: hypothetical protein R3Y33_04155 [Clostridia bacterium]
MAKTLFASVPQLNNTSDFLNTFDKNYNNIEISEDEVITALNDDPQIDFFNVNASIDNISIFLKDKTDESLPITIYYAKNNVYTGDNSVAGVISENENSVTINLPKDNYTNIRIDIGIEEGITYSVASITYSSGSKADLLYMFIAFASFLVLLYLAFRNNIKRFFVLDYKFPNKNICVAVIFFIIFVFDFYKTKDFAISIYYASLFSCLILFAFFEFEYQFLKKQKISEVE